MRHVKIHKRGDRGFHGYGAPMTCTYGTTIEVYQSSSAEGPRVWLSLVEGRSLDSGPGRACAHLTPRQAQEVIRRLQTWLEREAPRG